ncbi:MAG TPA: dienelactone hydrolase family protein [Polyangiaceae bacterium]|nr:dienelactone hydrolase family protein [Polyangiaceae bacterium]
MPRREVTIRTRDGRSPASVFTPSTGEGPWPAVLFFMDGRGIRPALFEMGQRLADAGYYVLLPDLFYRAGPYEAPSPKLFSEDPEARKRWQTQYTATASKANVKSDTEAFLAFLAEQREVSSPRIGTTGYCMGGGLSLAAAGNFPDRVVAAASFHGGNLATDAPDSPHRLADRIKARVYVAGAVEDASFDDAQKARLIDALGTAGVDHTVETYEGARHGWVPPDSPVHQPEGAERHWRTLIALFDATLKRRE